MRVVISDLPPDFSEEVPVDVDGVVTGNGQTKTLKTDLKRAMELLEEARENDPPETEVTVNDDGEEVDPGTDTDFKITVTADDLELAIEDLDKKAPAPEQLHPNNGSGTIISKFIYNTVTTLYVGEKIMIQMPTWFFPAGAGPYSEAASFTTHGEPSPTATFRFAEPVFVDKQQNFRVEIEVPDTDVLKEVQKIYGPLFIWVVLDGYMVRDVQ